MRECASVYVCVGCVTRATWKSAVTLFDRGRLLSGTNCCCTVHQSLASFLRAPFRVTGIFGSRPPPGGMVLVPPPQVLHTSRSAVIFFGMPSSSRNIQRTPRPTERRLFWRAGFQSEALSFRGQAPGISSVSIAPLLPLLRRGTSGHPNVPTSQPDVRDNTFEGLHAVSTSLQSILKQKTEVSVDCFTHRAPHVLLLK